MNTLNSLGPIDNGKTARAIMETTVGADVTNVSFSVDADTLLVTLNIISIAPSTSLSINMYGRAGTTGSNEKLILSFPVQTAATTELLVQKSAISLSNARIEATYDGAVSYEVWVRGVSGSVGDQTIKIIPGGADSLRASQTTITTAASLLVPPTPFDRAGIIIRNWNQTSGVLYIKEDSTSVTSVGYPLAPLEALAMDVDSNVSVYAQADTGTIDVRILEGGS